MKKITSTNSRKGLGILTLLLILGFSSIGLASANTNRQNNQIETSSKKDLAQSKIDRKKSNNKQKQEKVHVILNGDTIVSYAAVDSTVTDLSNKEEANSTGVINVNTKNEDVDKDTVNKIYSISNNIENILSTLGNSTFGSIIGVIIGLLIAGLVICFVVFILGFPIWIILFIVWLYRRIKKNREDERKRDEASFTYNENLDTKQEYNNNEACDFSQNLNHNPNDYNYREAIMSANNMIESATRQIFVGIGVGLFLMFFISDDMGLAIGTLITLIGIGKRISGKQRLKNIKEYCTDRDNYYSKKENSQEGQKEKEVEEVENDQQEPPLKTDSQDNDNCQQL